MASCLSYVKKIEKRHILPVLRFWAVGGQLYRSTIFPRFVCAHTSFAHLGLFCAFFDSVKNSPKLGYCRHLYAGGGQVWKDAAFVTIVIRQIDSGRQEGRQAKEIFAVSVRNRCAYIITHIKHETRTAGN